MGERTGDTGGNLWGGADESRGLQRYQTLVNTIDDGLYQLDTEGNFVAVNDEIVEATGYSRDDLVGEHVSELLAPDDIERLERAIEESLSDGRDDAFEHVVKIETADGERLPVELRGSLLTNGGEFHGTVGVARGLSDERRQERVETALGSYEPLTTVLDEAEVGVFVLDSEFDVAWVDETAEEYFGIDRSAVIGRDKRDLIEETIRDRVADGEAFADTVLSTYEDNSYVERFECRVTPGDGREERWLEHRSEPIESGRYAGGRVELYYDVTDQHRRASRLRRLNAAVNEWLEESSREAVADRATRYLRDVLELEINGIYLHDPATETLRPVNWTDRAETLFDEIPTFAAGEGIAWRVFESGEPAVYDDVTTATAVYDPETPIRSEIVLPIGDHGVAIAGSETVAAFDETDLTLAKLAASSLEATFDRIDRERDLERERDLTDRVLDATPVGALVLDADGEVTRMNDRAVDILEIDDPETYDPSDRPTYDEDGERIAVDDHPFTAALETGEPVYDHVLQVELPSGDRRWLSVNAVPITDGDDEIDRVVTTGEDVTDLKERERRLETELSEMFGRVSDAVYALDEEYRFTYLNERAAALLEVGEDAARGERLDEVYPETDEIERLRESVDRAMETQEPTQLEQYSELLEGWFEATVYPSESGVSVYFRDVTERRKRERDLELFRTLLDQSTDAIFVVDPETGRILDVNETATRQLGYDREELLELTVPDIDLELRTRSEWQAFVTDVRTEGRTTLDGIQRRKDGSTFPVEVNVSHVELDREYLFAVSRDVTERREMERELRERTETFQQVAENIDQVLWMSDPVKEEMIYVNAAYEDVWGRSRESLYEEPVSFLEAAHPDDRERVREAIPDQRRGEYDEEYRVVQPDGTVRWVHDRAVPIRDEDGEIYRIVGVVDDVTERREAERELRERERQLSTLMDNVPGMVYRCENERGWPMEFVSGGAEELIGYDPDVLERGEVVYGEDVVLEGDSDELWETIQDEVTEGDPFTVTYRIETADGDLRWVREYGRPVFEDGDLAALEGVAIDITERKEIEQELRESEAKFRTLAENVDEIVWMTTADPEAFLYVNPTYEGVWGRSRESLYEDPLSFLEAVHPDDRERVREAYTSLPEGEYDEEFRVVRPDGSVRWVHAQAVPVREDGEGRSRSGDRTQSGDGDVVRIVGVAADVTERRERERELREAKSQLEAAIDAGAVGTWEWHVPEDRFVAGEAFARTFGVDPEAAKEGVSLDRFVGSVHEDDRERVAAAIEDALETCGEYEEEYRVRNGDGELRWVLARGHVECDEDGNPISFPGTLVDITERKRAERELQETTEQLETLFDVLPVGAVVANADGSLRRANDVAKEIWGGDVFDAESVAEYEKYAARWADTGEPVDPDEWTMAQVLRGEEVMDPNVYEIETFDGEERIILEHGMPVRDERGNVSLAVVTLTDITERREYRRRLETSERRHRTLVENFPNGAVALFDEDLEYTAVGGEYFDEEDIDPDERIGNSIYETYPDDLVAELEPRFETVLEGEEHEFEVTYNDRHLSLHTVPVRDADGEIYAGMIVAEDVTERIERERELERALDLLNKTERIADVAGWEVDPETRQPYWSDHLFELLDVDYDHQPSLDEALDVYYTEEDRKIVENAVEDALETGEPFDVETRFPRPDGDVGWLRIQGDPELEDGEGRIPAGNRTASGCGEVVAIRGAVQDVTERKRRERRLEELVEQLEESNERLQQFAYAASHDLQEPLRMVSSYLQLLERRYGDDLDEDGREFIDFAVDGAERMKAMIEGLLAYSRVETRGNPFEPVALEDVLDDVLDDLQFAIEESETEITTDELPRVEGDASQLRQVFQNLLKNAIEYSGDEPPRIHVGAERDGDEWLVSVSDEGIGIDPDDQDRIFEVFQRLHSHEEHDGSGIGLALCERIVERHDGDMWVDSEPGEGSTFSFTLPVAEAHD